MKFSSTMLNTAGRYVLTAAGAVVATLGAVGLMSQTDAATATTAIKSITDSLGSIALAITTLVGVAGPIYAGFRGTANDTQANQVAAVQKLAQDPEAPVKGVVLAATVAGREMKESVPGPGVVLEGSREAAVVAKPSTGDKP